jgi:hypothetical protein
MDFEPSESRLKPFQRVLELGFRKVREFSAGGHLLIAIDLYLHADIEDSRNNAALEKPKKAAEEAAAARGAAPLNVIPVQAKVLTLVASPLPAGGGFFCEGAFPPSGSGTSICSFL